MYDVQATLDERLAEQEQQFPEGNSPYQALTFQIVDLIYIDIYQINNINNINQNNRSDNFITNFKLPHKINSDRQ